MKKKKLFILFISVVAALLIISLFIHSKTYNLRVEIIKSVYSDITLSENGKSCVVNTIIKKSNEEIINELLIENGYKESNGYYKRSYNINKKCDTLYEKYKNYNKEFSLIGSDDIKIEYDSEYKDSGYKADDKVILVKDVDVKNLGTNYVIYKLDNEIYNKYLVRKVEIIDSVKPVITLTGNSTVTVYLNNDYNEQGATANDNYDGDLTDKIVTSGNVDNKKVGKYEITYTVKDTSGNETSVIRTINVKEKQEVSYSNQDATELTYIKGILVVNKKYGLPKNYNPGENKEAKAALNRMQADASALGLSLKLISGFRTYSYQANLYNRYVQKDGQAKADTYSARPGHSEHQTGLAFDVGQISDSFGNTASGKWLAQNCHLYGFIIRYPQGKSHITGYKYEPWHIRYLGVETATKVKESGLTLEEYLGIN